MKISKVNKQTFKSLCCSGKIVSMIAKYKASKAFLEELSTIKNIVTENKLDSKPYIDICLDYSKRKGFSATAMPQNIGATRNSDSTIFLSMTKEGIEKFINWANKWNDAYAPKNIAKIADKK